MSEKTGVISSSIISAVFLSGFAVIKCNTVNNITVVLKGNDSIIKITDPGGTVTTLDKPLSEILLKAVSGTEKERTYSVEISGSVCKDASFNIRCGKNGGWYIADKFLLGGIIGVMVIDPASNDFWILPPDTLRGKTKEIKAAAMIKDDSDELSLVFKNCMPDEIFKALPFKKISA